jgi:hypothetical protein
MNSEEIINLRLCAWTFNAIENLDLVIFGRFQQLKAIRHQNLLSYIDISRNDQRIYLFFTKGRLFIVSELKGEQIKSYFSNRY